MGAGATVTQMARIVKAKTTGTTTAADEVPAIAHVPATEIFSA